MMYISRPFGKDSTDKENREVLARIAAWDAMQKGMRPLHQTMVWARFMAWLLGPENVEFYDGENGEDHARAQSFVYVYPLPLGTSWLYTPRGPLTIGGTSAAQQLLSEASMRHPNAVWTRWDPLSDEGESKGLMHGSREAHAHFHPLSTLLLNLTQSEEEILAQMKPKGRYNIRLAEKKGVQVFAWSIQQGQWTALDEGAPTLSFEEAVMHFTQLARETTARDKFSGHSASYYKNFLTSLDEHAFLLLARFEGTWIAGGLFTIAGETCTYYYGASGSAHRAVMAPYLVQWSAIVRAKKHGCAWYDFLGIATPDSPAEEDRSLAGVTDFKRKFGGEVRTGGRAFEKIHRPWLFFLIRSVKTSRKFLSRLRGA